MPSELLGKIHKVIYPPSQTVWMRIGISIPISMDDVQRLIKRSKEDHEAIYWSPGYADVDLSEDEADLCLRLGFVDGDSYIPACVVEELDKKLNGGEK